MSQTTSKAKNSGPSASGRLYLLAYNAIQTIGFDTEKTLSVKAELAGMESRWTYLLLKTLGHFLERGTLDTFWNEIKWIVIIFQNAAILEILHAAVGLVPSGVVVTLAQVYSRVFLVLGVLISTHGATISPGLPLCILAWSITESIRYGYYALNLLKVVPQFLLVLRYSTFLVLYPLGVTGELLCMYHALDEVQEKELFTLSLPNAWNFSFNYYYFLIFYMFLYIPLFPVLFGHMLAQRKKMLGNEPKKSK